MRTYRATGARKGSFKHTIFVVIWLAIWLVIPKAILKFCFHLLVCILNSLFIKNDRFYYDELK